MSEIRISRSHGMTLKKAKAAAERIADELSDEFDIDYGWNGNILEFQRSGVAGSITVDKTHVEIYARLGLLLILMRPRIEREIHRFCDENFGTKA
jgi:putative polyhydroxyalkanoate system protein